MQIPADGFAKIITSSDRAISMSKILIIDDDPSVANLLSQVVTRLGHQATCADCAAKGLQAASSGNYEVVLLDVGLPDADGLEIMPEIREHSRNAEVIILTGKGDPDAAESAIRNGAWDYLVKPSPIDHIMQIIERAISHNDNKRTKSLMGSLKRDDLVGCSAAINATLERIAHAATVEANVLINGQTGTGKELMARIIHNNSSRRNHRFVIVDCAALPESLVESVLFGHTRGAFTGAHKERQGLIRQAHGGTLFLDEIGELPLSIQKTFLRVIQERRFRPISSREEIEVNFRMIAATNRDLDAMASKGLFRSDLLFRLRSFAIEAPALHQHKGDIRHLTDFYIHRFSELYGTQAKTPSFDFLEALEQYDWPGNVRELFHTLEESISMAADDPTLYPHHLPTRIRAILTRESVKASTVCPSALPNDPTRGHGGRKFLKISEYRNKMERRYLEQLTRFTGGNRKQACSISGLSRTRLFELLKKHDLAKLHPGNPVCANHLSGDMPDVHLLTS
jgi:two-component system NtrC family response regulator